jgi:hypothetical protein
MGCEYTCDGCGKKAPAIIGGDREFHKPEKWYERADEDGIQVACSRECIKKIAEKTGKTVCIFPF